MTDFSQTDRVDGPTVTDQTTSTQQGAMTPPANETLTPEDFGDESFVVDDATLTSEDFEDSHEHSDDIEDAELAAMWRYHHGNRFARAASESFETHAHEVLRSAFAQADHGAGAPILTVASASQSPTIIGCAQALAREHDCGRPRRWCPVLVLTAQAFVPDGESAVDVPSMKSCRLMALDPDDASTFLAVLGAILMAESVRGPTPAGKVRLVIATRPEELATGLLDAATVATDPANG